MDEGERVVNKGWMSMNKAKKREKILHSLDISAGVVWYHTPPSTHRFALRPMKLRPSIRVYPSIRSVR